MTDQTFVREWWLEGCLADSGVWHPLYGPLPEHEVKRLRNYFLDTPDEQLITIDAGLANYEDYRARKHPVYGKVDTKHRKAIVRVAAIDPEIGTSPMKKIKEPTHSRQVAKPILSSQTVIRVPKRKS